MYSRMSARSFPSSGGGASRAKRYGNWKPHSAANRAGRRYKPPVQLIKLTGEQGVPPYVWIHPEDILIRDLTAHRTLGLRLALSEQPEIAIVAVTHALTAQIFYRGADAHVLDIRPVSTVLASHADGIEDSKAGKAWADHHASWAAQMPRDVTDLWTFVAELDHDSRMALFAHCVALAVNVVKLPMERKPRAMATADRLAEAVSLDMTAHWVPTARTYLGRVTKPHILAAVREAVSDEAANRMADMKKQAMAEAAEQLLVGTGWLPALMRTRPAAQERAEQPQADAVTGATDPDVYSVAAE